MLRRSVFTAGIILFPGQAVGKSWSQDASGLSQDAAEQLVSAAERRYLEANCCQLFR